MHDSGVLGSTEQRKEAIEGRPAIVPRHLYLFFPLAVAVPLEVSRITQVPGLSTGYPLPDPQSSSRRDALRQTQRRFKREHSDACIQLVLNPRTGFAKPPFSCSITFSSATSPPSTVRSLCVTHRTQIQRSLANNFWITAEMVRCFFFFFFPGYASTLISLFVKFPYRTVASADQISGSVNVQMTSSSCQIPT